MSEVKQTPQTCPLGTTGPLGAGALLGRRVG